MVGKNTAFSVGIASDTSVSLSASASGAEAEVISKERWEQIGQMAAAGRSISAIARELDLDRKTVRHSLRKQQWAPYRREQTVTLLLAPHEAWLKERAPRLAEALSQMKFTGAIRRHRPPHYHHAGRRTRQGE